MTRTRPASVRTRRAIRNGRPRPSSPAARQSGAAVRPSARRQMRHGAASPEGATVLAIDVGNTQTVLGVLRGPEVLDLFRLNSAVPRTGDELFPTVDRLLAPYREALRSSGRAVIGSVVPSLTPAWEGLVVRLLDRPALVAGAGQAGNLTIDLLDPASLGVDRICNAVAVAALYRVPAIVVDLGTATTFDVVLKGPRYVGGAILPGIVTSAEELFRRAARLAKVELRRPPRVLGRNTEESIQSGVFYGAVAQIDGLVERLRRELRIRPLVVATGGLAGSLAEDSATIEVVDPALTLQGLRILGERASSRPSRSSVAGPARLGRPRRRRGVAPSRRDQV